MPGRAKNDLIIVRHYQPDIECQLRALRILLDLPNAAEAAAPPRRLSDKATSCKQQHPTKALLAARGKGTLYEKDTSSPE